MDATAPRHALRPAARRTPRRGPRARVLPGALALVGALLGALGACAPDGPAPVDPAPQGPAGSSTGAAGGGDPASPRRRPHIVLYLIDTLRADRLGCYGHERDTSPTIDALAAEGVRVETALSQGPWTLPSCVSLQTSSYISNHAVVRGGDRAPQDVTLLVEFLDDLGYTTAGFIHNRLGGSMAGLDQGYDHLVERPSTRDMTDEDRARGLHTLRPFHEWIGRQDGSEPLFVYIHTSEPHHPYEGTFGGGQSFGDVDPAERDELNRLLGQHRGMMGGTDLTTDAAARAEYDALTADLTARMPAIDALYDGDVRRADENVARVLASLRRAGLWEDTLFLLVADHGEEFLDHGTWMHDQSVHAELVHVPMILRIPGLADQGAVLPGPGQLVDIGPTLAELLGAPAPKTWLGRSLVPALTALRAGDELPLAHGFTQRINLDRQLKTARHESGYRETAMVEGHFKAILRHDVERLLLYDLSADPGETHDLAAARPQRAAAMRAAIEDWIRAQRDRRLPKPVATDRDDEGLRQQLAELGYLDRGVGADDPVEVMLDLLGEEH